MKIEKVEGERDVVVQVRLCYTRQRDARPGIRHRFLTVRNKVWVTGTFSMVLITINAVRVRGTAMYYSSYITFLHPQTGLTLGNLPL